MTQSTPDPLEPRHARIRRLNDAFRRTWTGGEVVVTQGVHALGPVAVSELLALVRQFDAFTEDIDPWGEHEFGALAFKGERVFWKIDYYAPDLCGHSANAADPEVTIRVLTIMLAFEY